MEVASNNVGDMKTDEVNSPIVIAQCHILKTFFEKNENGNGYTLRTASCKPAFNALQHIHEPIIGCGCQDQGLASPEHHRSHF